AGSYRRRSPLAAAERQHGIWDAIVVEAGRSADLASHHLSEVAPCRHRIAMNAGLRRWSKRIAWAIGVFLIGAPLVPVRRNIPPVQAAQTLFAVERVPPGVQSVLQRSCQNCHSNQTAWPWYSYLAPTSWIVASDVHEARKTMNFSEWGSYSA